MAVDLKKYSNGVYSVYSIYLCVIVSHDNLHPGTKAVT